MSSNKKLLLALLVLPVVLYIGVKLVIYSNTKNALQQLTVLAAPFVGIRYNGIGSSLAGSVRISNIQLAPTGMNDVVRIKHIDIETPGLGFLLAGTKRFTEGEFPESMQLTLQGVAVDMDGPMMGKLDRLAEIASIEHNVVPHCGGTPHVGPGLYRKLGYSTLVSDIRIGYELEKRLARLHVQTRWSTQDMGAISVDLFFAGVPTSTKEVAQYSPRLTEANVVYQDLSYTDRLKRYCASASNSSVEEYINAEVNQNASVFAQQWGFIPGPGLRAAYRQFLMSPGEVRLEMRPADGVDTTFLDLFRPEDALSLLNPKLSINGNVVTDLSFHFEAIKTPIAPNTRAANTDSERSQAKSGYHVIRTSELSKHLGRQVRIRDLRMAVREGVLAVVSPTLITLERRYGGGAMTFNVPMKQIEKAEVLF